MLLVNRECYILSSKRPYLSTLYYLLKLYCNVYYKYTVFELISIELRGKKYSVIDKCQDFQYKVIKHVESLAKIYFFNNRFNFWTDTGNAI